jgi:hypothetical protein
VSRSFLKILRLDFPFLIFGPRFCIFKSCFTQDVWQGGGRVIGRWGKAPGPIISYVLRHRPRCYRTHDRCYRTHDRRPMSLVHDIIGPVDVPIMACILGREPRYYTLDIIGRNRQGPISMRFLPQDQGHYRTLGRTSDKIDVRFSLSYRT